MRASELIRETGYWMYDRFRSGMVNEQFKELKNDLEALPLSITEQEYKLRMIIKYATASTNFYKQYSQAEELAQFPVVNREVFSARYEDFMSREFLNQTLKYGITSGSTGNPFRCPMTDRKWARRMAEVIYFNNLAGFRIGIKHLDIINKKKSKLVKFTQNAITLDSRVIDECWLAKARSILQLEKSLKVVISFTSTLLLLAKYCLAHNDEPDSFNLNSIILKGEPLDSLTKSIIRKAFSCKIYSRYASEEFGVIAQSCINNSGFRINNSSYLIELLALNSDRQAEPGELGRVVVTDYNSNAMPLIRYDIGDVAVFKENCSSGNSVPYFEYIEGRSIDLVYNTIGEYVSPFIINRILKEIDGITQFQFIQNSAVGYQINIIADKQYNKYNAELYLNQRLLQLLGDNAVIDFNYPAQITESISGKRHYIINRYLRNSSRY